VAKPAPRAVKPVQRLASITPDPAPAPVAKPRIRPTPVQAPAAVPPPPASTPAPPPAPDLLADTIKQVDDAAGKLDQTLKGMLSPPPQPPAGG
jgi:hypothetical protein